MVLVKNLKFVNVSFYAKYTQKKNLVTFLVKKQAFLDNLNLDVKRRQNWHFCTGDSP